MQFSDGIPQAVDRFPFYVIGLLMIGALAGWLRKLSRTKE